MPLDGIVTLTARDQGTRAPGGVFVRMTGQHGDYPIVSGDQPIRIDLTFGGAQPELASGCAQSNFGPGDCVFSGAGKTLTCR